MANHLVLPHTVSDYLMSVQTTAVEAYNNSLLEMVSQSVPMRTSRVRSELFSDYFDWNSTRIAGVDVSVMHSWLPSVHYTRAVSNGCIASNLSVC